MNNSLKKFYATLLTVILIMVFSAPFTAFAQAGTLGTEQPVLTATFKNGDDVVDGNHLEVGSYTVDICLSGMKSVSIFQITANINNIRINSASTIADRDSSFSCGAIVNENNSFVAILASENDNTSAISDGTAMVTLNVTVNTAGDFANYFVVSTDPNLTFVEADYGDGYDLAYVMEGNSSDLALMTYDMSPSLAPTTFDITGKVTIATDVNGATGDLGIGGITVSIDDTEISAVTAADGSYTLSGLAEGTYTMSIAGQTTIDRKVTLVVSGEKAIANIPVVICDYNKDTFVNDTDLGEFGGAFNNAGAYGIYFDFNKDGYVNDTDLGEFGGFFNKTISYQDVTL